jgi:hypothetical protein
MIHFIGPVAAAAGLFVSILLTLKNKLTMKKNLISRYNRRRLTSLYNRARRSMRIAKRKQFVLWDIIWEPPEIPAATVSNPKEEEYATKKNIATSNY